MTKDYVQKISDKLAEIAESIISDSSCLTFWGEVELPECMRHENVNETKTE